MIQKLQERCFLRFVPRARPSWDLLVYTLGLLVSRGGSGLKVFGLKVFLLLLLTSISVFFFDL
jgi:hypothetical protein